MGTIATLSGANNAGGEFVPMITYNAVHGRVYRIERFQNAEGNWDSEQHHLPLPVKFVADFPNMLIGQIAFINKRPDIHMVRLADVESGETVIPERPTNEHRIGFLIRVYNKTLGMREWRGM